MRYAITKDDRRVDSLIILDKEEKYYCPCCNGEVVLKRGKTNIPHFSHKNLQDCDISSSDMSEWHINWQNKFPDINREVIIKHTFNIEDAFTLKNNLIIGKEYIHRADICINNYVIEFQHSSITKEQFDLRNYFYVKSGYKVIWVFDFIEECKNQKMECYDSWTRFNDSGDKWRWNYPPRFLSNISPQRNKMIKIVFQYNESKSEDLGYLGLVTWAADSNTDIYSTDYKRFFTSYSISTFTELYNSIINNKI